MISCEGRYTNNCTGVADCLVNFSDINLYDGMPEPGTEVNLCSPCADFFISINPEARKLNLPGEGKPFVAGEKEL